MTYDGNIDTFMRVNDSFGREAGAAVLLRAALDDLLRKYDR
jgi:GGDEF domain-containing protein